MSLLVIDSSMIIDKADSNIQKRERDVYKIHAIYHSLSLNELSDFLVVKKVQIIYFYFSATLSL